MTLMASSRVYLAISLLYALLFGAGAYTCIRYDKKRSRGIITFGIVCLCSVLMVGISLYNSWFIDFQAQGRYLFPILMMIAFLFRNWDAVENKLFKRCVYSVLGLTVLANAYLFINGLRLIER